MNIAKDISVKYVGPAAVVMNINNLSRNGELNECIQSSIGLSNFIGSFSRTSPAILENSIAGAQKTMKAVTSFINCLLLYFSFTICFIRFITNHYNKNKF